MQLGLDSGPPLCYNGGEIDAPDERGKHRSKKMGNLADFISKVSEAVLSFEEPHDIIKFECENPECGEKGVLSHRKGSFPEFCPHCGLSGDEH